MDSVEIGTRYGERFNDASLEAQLENSPDPNADSEQFCIDCAEEVPEMRREIPGVTRCVECQDMHEAREARK